MLPIERDAVEELLEVIVALVLDHTVPRPETEDRWPMLLGMCDLCERSASTLERADPEAARLIRKAIALTRTDLFETRGDVAKCLEASSDGLAQSQPTETGYYEFLGTAIRCHIAAKEFENALRFLVRGIEDARDSEMHERTLSDLFKIGSRVEATYLSKSSKMKALAIQMAKRANLRSIHSLGLDWDKDAQDTMMRISSAFWNP